MPIPPLTPEWLAAFEKALQTHWGINLDDAGGQPAASFYTDLDPASAALMHGEDLGLQRIDQGWY